MLRVLLGIIKGVVIGGALGYGASRVGFGEGSSGYLLYAAVGFLVGIIGGKAIWRQETLITPALKGLVGAGILAGLYWVAQKFLGGLTLPLPADVVTALSPGGPKPLAATPALLAPALAILYGIFVEVDDGGSSKPAPPNTAPAPRAP